MTHTFKIRVATEADAPLLQKIGSQTFSETFAEHNTPEDLNDYLSKTFSLPAIENELKHPDAVFFIAYDNSNVAGYAKMNRNNFADGLHASKPLEIQRIYTTREYLGKNAGKTLMTACLDYAREHNHDVVWLGVWEHNPRAIAFYERWGFETFGHYTFLLGQDPQTDLLMKKTLTDSQ